MKSEKSDLYSHLDAEDWAFIEQARQPKPMPPASKTRHAKREWEKKFKSEHGVCSTTWRNWRKTPEGRARIAAWETAHKKES